MLHFVRRHAQSKFVKVVLGIIIAVFVLWGVEAVVSGGNPLTTIATVDGRPIEQISIQRAELNLTDMYRNAYRGSFTPEVRRALNLRQRALDGLIDRLVLLNEAERLGLQIGDHELRDAIVNSPGFQAGGRFNKELYLRIVRGAGMTPADYEQSRREDLAVERLQGVVLDGVKVTDAEARDEILARETKRSLAYVKFAASDQTVAVEPTEEELKAYYEENKTRYTEPEKARVELLTYSPERFEEGVEVTEEEIAEYYEANRETRFTQPHEVRARNILIRVPRDADEETKAKARKKLEEVQAKLAAGADFAELAREYSEDPGSRENGGDLGFFPRGRMVGPFEDAAFSLKPGEISDIVESPFGLNLLKVEEIREERVKPLEEVREEIVATLRREAAAARAREAAEADQQALASETIDQVAEKRGLTVERPEPLGRGDAFPSLGRSLPLTTALWELQPGGYTDPVEVNGNWVIARLVEIVPSRVPELGEVRERVDAAYRLKKGGEFAKAEAEKLHAAAKAEGSLAKAAEAAGKTVLATSPFARAGGFIPGVGSSPELKNAAFALRDDAKLADSVFVVAGDAYVVELAEETVPSEEEIAKKLDETKQQLLERRRNATFERYLTELKKKARIEIDPQRLAQIPAI